MGLCEVTGWLYFSIKNAEYCPVSSSARVCLFLDNLVYWAAALAEIARSPKACLNIFPEFFQMLSGLMNQVVESSQDPELVEKVKVVNRQVLRYSMQTNLQGE